MQMITKSFSRWMSAVWAGCLVTGCGAPPSVTPAGESAGIDDDNNGAFVFADDDDPAQAATPYVEDELLVQPFPGAEARALREVYADAGALVVDEISEIGMTVLEVPTGNLAAVAADLAASNLIEDIHKNYVYEAQETPDDPLFGRQSHLAQIRAAEAWDITSGSEDIVIAIVDTGVDPNHPDLAAKIIDGWNIYDDDDDFDDVKGHGTQAAGVAAAASDNGVGIAGVAWANPILAVRVTDVAGRSTSRDIAAGILWAVGKGAKVINVSFAPLWSNSIVRSAAQQAYNRGSLVVISAGNEGGMSESAGFAEALFVGAVDGADEIASFSDRGPFVDLVAPGTGIRATTLDADYRLVNGTSFAAPIVSGVAALAWSINPDLRPATIARALRDSALDLGSTGADDTFGYGAVDALNAVEAAAEAFDERDAAAPTLSITNPSDGGTLTGRSTVKVTATDRGGVADVVLFVDGVAFATDTRAPYRFVIDASGFNTGTHELSFIATDFAGNQSAEKAVTVEFGESRSVGGGSAPSVVFESPKSGARVSGNVTIDATISAENGLAVVEWLVDGTSAVVNSINGESSHISYLWRSSVVPAGRHTITVVITDARGEQASGSLELVTR